MKKYKRSELESLREIIKSRKGKREHYLAYGYLRGVPYRVLERKTDWDDNIYHDPGYLVYYNFHYKVGKIIIECLYSLKYTEAQFNQETKKFILPTPEQQKVNEIYTSYLSECYKSPELKQWFLEKKDV